MIQAIRKLWRLLLTPKRFRNMTDEEIRLCLLRAGFKEETYKVLARIMLLGQIHNPTLRVTSIDREEWKGFNLLMRDDDMGLICRSMATRKSLSVQYHEMGHNFGIPSNPHGVMKPIVMNSTGWIGLWQLPGEPDK